MQDQKIKKLVLAALFAALSCVMTMVVKIPIPGTGGYIHPGDAMVILCGIFLGPVTGGLAAGIGSAMADLLGGYFIYVPITFIVKGLVALLAALAFDKVRKANGKAIVGVIIGGVIDTVVVVIGYWLPEIVMYGFAAATASMLPNMVQGISGLILSAVLYPILSTVFKQIDVSRA